MTFSNGPWHLRHLFCGLAGADALASGAVEPAAPPGAVEPDLPLSEQPASATANINAKKVLKYRDSMNAGILAKRCGNVNKHFYRILIRRESSAAH